MARGSLRVASDVGDEYRGPAPTPRTPPRGRRSRLARMLPGCNQIIRWRRFGLAVGPASHWTGEWAMFRQGRALPPARRLVLAALGAAALLVLQPIGGNFAVEGYCQELWIGRRRSRDGLRLSRSIVQS